MNGTDFQWGNDPNYDGGKGCLSTDFNWEGPSGEGHCWRAGLVRVFFLTVRAAWRTRS